jgi:hypothetical protein
MTSLGVFLIWVAGYMVTGTYRLVHTPYPVRLDDFIGAVFVAATWPIAVPIIMISNKFFRGNSEKV